MATKVKPSRLQISGTPQAGQVPVYVDADNFQWCDSGGCAQWGCITGTLCDQTDLQGALNCKANACDIPTDNCQLANGCGYTTCTGTVVASDLTPYAKTCDLPDFACYQTKSCMVCNLTSPDDSHYPTSKAVADAMACAGTGDMLKSVYDPNNIQANVYDYCNFVNTPTIPTNNCQLTNGCGYTTCTGTLVASDLTPYAKSCDVPTKTMAVTDGNYLYNGQNVNTKINCMGISNTSNLLDGSTNVAIRSNSSNPFIGLQDCSGNKYYLQETGGAMYFGPTSACAMKFDVSGNATFQGGSVEAKDGFIKTGGTSSQFLKADGSVDSNAYITSASVPTKTSDLINDSGFITSASLPTVNDATLTISQGGTSKGTFTANSSTNASVDLNTSFIKTQTEYDNLPASKTSDGNFYFIYSS